MEDNKFEEYWKGRYEDQIQWYEKKSTHNKKRYQYVQFSVIIFSALTPLLIAMDFVFEAFNILKWISIFTSVAIAILVSTLRIFKFQDHWVNYRTTAELLKKEQHLYKANTGGYDKVQDKRALFVKRVESLISQAHTEWVEKYQNILGESVE
ncbi:MAG: DUF4231 domain-containing protein [Promethearchaeia archaeon]